MLASPSAAKSHDKSVRKNAEPVEGLWSRVTLILTLWRFAVSDMAFPAFPHLPWLPLHLARSLALLRFHHEPHNRAICRASFEACLLGHICSSRHLPALVRPPAFSESLAPGRITTSPPSTQAEGNSEPRHQASSQGGQTDGSCFDSKKFSPRA